MHSKRADFFGSVCHPSLEKHSLKHQKGEVPADMESSRLKRAPTPFFIGIEPQRHRERRVCEMWGCDGNVEWVRPERS